jgi:competence protein ComFC
LQTVSRIPLCAECLLPPEPLHADYACVSCRTPFLNQFPLDDQGRCALCRSGLRGFDAAYCFGSYEGLLREWIHLYKYSRIKPLARPLGRLLAEAVPGEEKFDAIVPVPLHWLRRWHRGFNQSEILARSLGRQLGVPLVFALRRTRSTQAQAGLSNTARRQNVAQAFRSRSRHLVAGKRVLLVDDVMTTGSTAAACARTLKQAGAARVTLVTVARVDRRLAAAPHLSSQSSAGDVSDAE